MLRVKAGSLGLLKRYLIALSWMIASGVTAQSQEQPAVERGDQGYISEWLKFDFHSCLGESGVDGAQSCLVSAITVCNEHYFYRHCNNNAVSISIEWTRQELVERGAEEDLIERWLEATKDFCELHYEFWSLNDAAPPSGLRWDNSVTPCINTRVFDALGYL